MEVVSEDGSQIRIKLGQTRDIGREDGLNSSDKTVSRRHLSFFIPGESNNQETQLRFEVLGRNPIYVNKDNEVKIFRRFERGDMGNGDMFCISAKNPVWYTVRTFQKGAESVRRNDLESQLEESLESGFGENLREECPDISDIDPVKEFGFLVEGHEFDSYPKKMIKCMKNWEWFLDEGGNESEDDDGEGKKGKSRRRRKRKKGGETEDDEWTGESEDDRVLIDNSIKGKYPKYKTRSKDHGKDASKRKRKSPTRTEDIEDDEEDETLGGFIVDDDKLEEEEELGDAEEEEEELADEDEDE